jgi:hypothetical protein
VPIAYYLKSIGLPDNFEISTSTVEDRQKIKRWFVSALLKRIFSYNPDGALKPVRKIINENTTGGFPLEKIIDHFKGTNRTLQFTDDDINNLMYSKYGHGDTLVILSILYPWADLRNNFHVDHMFPKSKFTSKQLKAEGVDAEKVNDYIGDCNFIGNLQLLESIPNIEKSAMNFDKWLNTKIPADGLDDYKKKNYIPDVDLSFKNFGDFLEKREGLLLAKLKEELQQRSQRERNE